MTRRACLQSSSRREALFISDFEVSDPSLAAIAKTRVLKQAWRSLALFVTLLLPVGCVHRPADTPVALGIPCLTVTIRCG